MKKYLIELQRQPYGLIFAEISKFEKLKNQLFTNFKALNQNNFSFSTFVAECENIEETMQTLKNELKSVSAISVYELGEEMKF